MKPKVLVIGGSYFAGRVFTMVASGSCALTLLNRGRYSMTLYPDVTELRCDRHDAAALAALPAAGKSRTPSSGAAWISLLYKSSREAKQPQTPVRQRS